MNLHLFSKSFIKQMSLLGTAALLAYPQVISANEAQPESDVVSIVQQTTIEVKGVVYDPTGMTVIGASIIEKGNPGNGTITDIDGNFTMKVPENATLVISYIGYVTQEVKVTPGKPMNITLLEDNQMLQEVVVVGYGVQKKVNLTGSVAMVEGETLEQRPLANATQSLQGMVPGLYVDNSNAGRPGATSTLQLRGQGNLSGTGAPYVLVDGVEMDLADVNPNDIESISVLKDAAASSIYGARAAYGVILVTTKKGKEGKTRVSYQATLGWTQPMSLPNMANAVDFANFFNAGTYNYNKTTEYSAEKIQALQNYMTNGVGDPWAELNPNSNMIGAFENSANGLGNVDYFDLHYKNAAFKQNHNVSISGGGEKAQYYISGGMYKEEGLLRYADIDYKRFNFNANITSTLTDWMKLKVNTKYMNSNNETPFGTGALSEGFYSNLARMRPTISVVDPNGYFTELSMIPYLQSGTNTNTQNNNLTLTGGVEFEPIKNWHIFVDYTYRYNTRDYDATKILPNIPNATDTGTTQGTRTEMYAGGAMSGYTRSNLNNQYQSLNIYTNYNFSLADKHNFTFMLGYQEEYYKYKYLSASVTGLQYEANPSLEMADGDRTLGDQRYAWATRGYFGRINYDFMGKYLVEVNGRYDGSSRFAKNNRWGFFPSVSLGWRISEEAFMEKTRDWMSNLKLRVSWGLLGNQAGAAYYTFTSSMDPAGIGGWYFNGVRSGYYRPGDVIDSNTTWEKVDHKNIGIDFGFFNNQLTGTFDVFQRDTRDMLGPSVPLADMFGAVAPETNNAEMRNRGWEMTLQWRGKIGSDIDYSIGGSISDATAEITSYDGGFTDPAGDNSNGWYKGKKIGEIWGYRTAGIIQTQEEADEYNKLDLTYLSGLAWEPGDVKYLDLNGDGKVNSGTNVYGDMGDRVVIGNTTPRYQYTINGSISWKGLSLSLMFQGVGKRDWCPGSGTVYFWGSNAKAQVTVFDEHMDYWTEDNRDAYYPKPYIGPAGANNVAARRNKTSQKADRYVQNAAYCRLKNLTLSYNLPEKWISKVHLTKAQIFFSGENLLTFTKLKIFDPEGLFTNNTSVTSNADILSSAGKNYPMTRVFSVGVILNM